MAYLCTLVFYSLRSGLIINLYKFCHVIVCYVSCISEIVVRTLLGRTYNVTPLS